MRLTVVSFNVEDFTVQPFHPPFCKNVDIVLVQEWNTGKGTQFVNFLGKNYTYVAIDRVAIIFNTDTFHTTTETREIRLKHEAPTKLEYTYTLGRVKSNILSILKTKNNKVSVAVISCHLSAFRVVNHPHFHRKQMTNLFRKALEYIHSYEKRYRTKCEIIIGGDTNYRKGNKTNLLKQLLPKKTRKNHRKQLHDVCEKTGCHKLPTHFFDCVHEKNLSKQLVQSYFHFRPQSKEASARLDLIATTMNVEESEIIPACKISDHSAVRCVLSAI